MESLFFFSKKRVFLPTSSQRRLNLHLVACPSPSISFVRLIVDIDKHAKNEIVLSHQKSPKVEFCVASWQSDPAIPEKDEKGEAATPAWICLTKLMEGHVPQKKIGGNVKYLF